MNLNIATLSTPELIILSVISIAILFFGYKIKKIAFFIIWFLIGYVLTNNYLLNLIIQWIPQISENLDLWNILIPIAGGLLLALLGFSIEKFCVGSICFALSVLVAAKYFGTDIQTLAIGAAIGVIAAILAIFLMKPATIILTSLIGSYAITLIIFNLAPNLDRQYFLLLIAGIAGVGTIVQSLTCKRRH